MAGEAHRSDGGTAIRRGIGHGRGLKPWQGYGHDQGKEPHVWVCLDRPMGGWSNAGGWPELGGVVVRWGEEVGEGKRLE